MADHVDCICHFSGVRYANKPAGDATQRPGSASPPCSNGTCSEPASPSCAGPTTNRTPPGPTSTGSARPSTVPNSVGRSPRALPDLRKPTNGTKPTELAVTPEERGHQPLRENFSDRDPPSSKQTLGPRYPRIPAPPTQRQPGRILEHQNLRQLADHLPNGRSPRLRRRPSRLPQLGANTNAHDERPSASRRHHQRRLHRAEGLTVTEAARILGVTRPTLSRVLNGRGGISPEMAIRIEKIGWSNAEFWMRLQTYYDLAQARLNEDRINVEPYQPAAAAAGS